MIKKPKLSKIIALVIIAWLAFSFIRNTYLLWKAGSRLDKAQEQLAAAQYEHQQLLGQLQIIDSPQFIEKEARDKLGLAKPQEIVVVLPPEEELKKIAPDLSPLPQTSLPNWRQWANLFLED